MLSACGPSPETMKRLDESAAYHAECAKFRYTYEQCSTMRWGGVPVSEFKEPPVLIEEVK